MDHDRGFAPNADYGICTLCGCKITTVEAWAKQGSWVFGIGGHGTRQPNKLIYAREVEETLPYAVFRARDRRKSAYLQGKPIDPAANVLLSRRFYYFGDRAIDIPEELQHIIIRRQGCKRLSDEDAARLTHYLAARYNYGKHGKPNNLQGQDQCGCRDRANCARY